MFRTRGIFRTLVYIEPWHIQNPSTFRTRSTSRTLLKIYDGVFCENSKRLYLFLQYQLFTFSTLGNKYHGFFNTSLVFTLEVFILCKKYRGQKGRGPWILISLHFYTFSLKKKNCYTTLFSRMVLFQNYMRWWNLLPKWRQ